MEEPIVVSCRRGEGGQSARRVCGDPETRGLLRRTSLWREHRFALTAGESSFRSEACRPSRFPWRASAATVSSRDAAPRARGTRARARASAMLTCGRAGTTSGAIGWDPPARRDPRRDVRSRRARARRASGTPEPQDRALRKTAGVEWGRPDNRVAPPGQGTTREARLRRRRVQAQPGRVADGQRTRRGVGAMATQVRPRGQRGEASWWRSR